LKKRDQFASQFGIIMAAVGSAVGLGNIWRFSYITGVNGGGAFLIVYLACVLLVGLPVLISELTIGRSSGLSTISAFQKLAPGTPWWIAGLLGVLAAVIIGFYYPTVSGWSLGYVFESLFNWEAINQDSSSAFGTFTAGWKALAFAGLSLLIALGVLLKGISAGIERVSKFLMPLLGVLLLVLVVRSLTLPGAMEGVKFLFYPDFSSLGVQGFLDALGHSFYSLSLGMGIMVTYASYMKKDVNLTSATLSVVSMDTIIALMAGLAIFPAVFAMGLDPAEGPGLTFVTLPGAFAQMPFGNIFSAIFFLLVFIAALTSLISILQVPLSLLEDRFGFSKNKGLAIVVGAVVCFGTPAVLSFGPMAKFTLMGKNIFSLMDWLSSSILLPITALIGCLFVVFKFGVAASKAEFLQGAKHPRHFLAAIYPFAIRFIAPIAIIIILIRATGLF
jgi:NSS family neurotransmitter:Na+ symporter